MERKVMRSNVTLSDGAHVPAGNYIVAAQSAVMRDAANYSNPDDFDPARFLIEKDGVTQSKSRFSHPSVDFLFWGSTRRAWYVNSSLGLFCSLRHSNHPSRISPARFLVSMIAKIIMRHLLLRYEFKLADENAPSTLYWDTNMLPHPRLRMLIRERTETH